MTRRGFRPIAYGVLIFDALLMSAFSLQVAQTPFVWIGLAWACALIGGVFCLRRSWPRALSFNAGFVALFLAAAEAYFLHGQHVEEQQRPAYSGYYFSEDDVLGTAPRRDARSHSTRSVAGRLLYDVTYSVHANGLRVSAPTTEARPIGSILFFGCSFTYGEGLEDDETLPYQVGVQSKEMYKTFNFGFHGYGPHQMLAAIQHGVVRRVVDCQPRYAIYQAIQDHALRVAGKVPFGRHGPRYVLDDDGSVQQQGHFDDQRPPVASTEAHAFHFLETASHALQGSGLYHMLTSRSARVSNEDVNLLLAVVRTSRDQLVAEYSGLEFHVLLWPDETDEKTHKELEDGLRKLKITLHLVEDILPRYNEDKDMYLIPGDRHPNALANRLLSEYLTSKMLIGDR